MKIIEVCVSPERWLAMQSVPYWLLAVGFLLGAVFGFAVAIWQGMRETRRIVNNF
jgi:hypothetical protein